MKLDFRSIRVLDIVNARAHPMLSGHYTLMKNRRICDGFIYIADGAARYTFDQQTLCVRKGDVLYLAKDSQYDIDVEEGFRVAYIDCYLETPEGVRYESARYTLGDGIEVERMIVRLANKWIVTNAAMRLQAFSTLYAIFSMIAQESAAGYLSPDNRVRVIRARESIEAEGLNKGFSCASLAQKLSMSDAHFRRLFSCLHGVTPSQYLTIVRMRKARELLMQSELSISEIAESIGYRSVYYFCRAFKRETGYTPTDYRKNAF